jgi:hypothetical protein
MKVITLTYPNGVYAVITTADFELTVKLPNGNECVASDLERLACDADTVVARHVRMAQRLRAAVKVWGAKS